MLVTTHLLSKFIDISRLPFTTIADDLSQIGLEVEALEEIKIDDLIVVGKIIEAKAHANADKLKVCKVDVGDEVLEIVCGASNAKEGLYVACARIGALVGGTKIVEAELRGVKSYGMLCSSAELGLCKGEGIIELDKSIGDLELGKSINSYSIFSGFVIEIGLTPNRGDCLSVLGVARELSALYDLHIKSFSLNTAHSSLQVEKVLQVLSSVKIDGKLLYKIAKIEGITKLLEVELTLNMLGLRNHSNIVNILNFITYLTGVNLNAYNYKDKNIESKNIDYSIAKMTIKDDENKLFSLYGNAKVSTICIGQNIETKDLSGSNNKFDNSISEIDDSFYIFEASYMEPSYIASHSKTLKTAKEVAINQDLLYKSARGLNPDLEYGMKYLLYYLQNNLNILVLDGSIEIGSFTARTPIKLNIDQINQTLGSIIPKTTSVEVLKKLNFEVNFIDEVNINIIPPAYRHDIATAQDIYEEILRFFGIDSISPAPLISRDIDNFNDNFRRHKFIFDLKTRLCALNYKEVLNYVFYSKEKLIGYGLPTLNTNLDLSNPINSDLNTLRTSLLPAMLDNINLNIRNSYPHLSCFEVGSIFDASRNESKSLAVVGCGLRITSNYPHPKGIAYDFFGFANDLRSTIGNFTLINAAPTSNLAHTYINALVMKNGKNIGFLAKLHPQIAKKLDIENCFIAEVNLDLLSPKTRRFSPYSKTQSIKRDLTINIAKNIDFAKIKDAIFMQNYPFLVDIIALDVFIQDDKALSFRMTFSDFDKTLDDAKINEIMDKIMLLVKEKFKAIIRL